MPRRASVSPSRDAGVKGITRKVIRHLEGLGHLVEGDIDDEMEDESREYYQDPKTYASVLTDSTALGVSDLHQLGAALRSAYLTPGSSSFIEDISTDVIDTQQVKVRVKAGGEGTVVFDSAIALLQGLFPPNPRNKVTLANGTEVMTPLGGYQYVPMETVEPGNDRSMESWTDCPAFQKHVAAFHASDAFKAKAKAAAPFFNDINDFVFGRTTALENIVYDFMNTQLTYNQTYAFCLPPTYIEQALAGRTILHTILSSLERIAFNADPLQLMVVQTTYQPFISLFHQTEMVREFPELAGIPNFGAALAIELRRGLPPDTRDFLRFKFRNGTADADGWRTVHAFGHRADIPLTEFIYRAEGSAITSNKQWAQVCGVSSSSSTSASAQTFAQTSVQFALGAMLFFVLALLFAVFVKKVKAKRAGYMRLPSDVEDAQMIQEVQPAALTMATGRKGTQSSLKQ
ncbi:phosphoglycerate mutase-like protein [Mycena amicta]|nr:phosphoglycerate mutase-like protein [Mycena amicta]